MKPDINIRPLDASEKDVILTIADWYHKEWQTPVKKTIRRLTNQPDRETLFQLVLTVDDRVVATGGLCNEVNMVKVYPEFGRFKPWVGLLYTHKDYRQQGLGSRLLRAIERRAKGEGYPVIYLYTFTAESLYRKCGWEAMDRVLYKDHETAVMKKAF